MKRFFLFSGLLVLFCLMFSCKSNSTTPTPKTPTTTAITVNSSSDLIYIGVSEAFTATMIMSDGTTKVVTAGVWSTDANNVATVNSSTGNVTCVGSGNVDIIVNYQGVQGVKRIRGLPNYQGTWSGSYYIVSCSDSGRVSGSCSSFPINNVFPCDLNLVQTHDAVTGSFYLGTLSASASGPVSTDGTLLLTGTISSAPWTVDVSWTMASKTAGNITGSLSEIWMAAGYSGDVRISATIRDLNRTSTMAGMRMNFGSPQGLNRTVQSLVRAMIGR